MWCRYFSFLYFRYREAFIHTRKRARSSELKGSEKWSAFEVARKMTKMLCKMPAENEET